MRWRLTLKKLKTWVFSKKKRGLKNSAKITANCLCQGLFFNKVTSSRRVTLLKKRLWHRCFIVNFAKFERTYFLQNDFGFFCVCFRVYLQHQMVLTVPCISSSRDLYCLYFDAFCQLFQYLLFNYSLVNYFFPCISF